jgi:cytochrome c551/c552
VTRAPERDTLVLVSCKDFRRILPLLVCAPGLFAWQAPPADTQNALVKQYCVTCHNDKLKTAGVSLEGLDVAKAGEDSAVWEKVLRKVASSQMPPAGLPHPDPEKSADEGNKDNRTRAFAKYSNVICYPRDRIIAGVFKSIERIEARRVTGVVRSRAIRP